MPVRRAYLDYNASAPLRPEARTAMLDALDLGGNPSSVHAEGRRARAIVERAREQVAALVGAKPEEVVFTSGGTEANNWVLADAWDVVMTPLVEHDSILATERRSGGMYQFLPVKHDGLLEMDLLIANLRDEKGRAVLSVQAANNETGVVQDVRACAGAAREKGLATHSDAVQAAGKIPLDFRALGVDFMSLSSHKIGGPKGAGAVVMSVGERLSPLIAGGGQERRQRAGTENVAGIAGFGAAAEAASRDLPNLARVAEMRDAIEREARRITPEAVIVAENSPRLPNTTCIALPGRKAETLVIALDLAGVAVSAGAACSSGKVARSHVLEAMRLGENVASSAIRVSIGWNTTDDDIEAFLAAWGSIAARRAPREAAA